MFQCEQCSLNFIYKTSLVSHRKTHLKLFKCQQCTSEFTAKRNLVRHEKTHTGVRYPCSICAVTFSYKFNLNRHIKKFHGYIQIAPHIFVPNIPAGTSSVQDTTGPPAHNDRLSTLRDNQTTSLSTGRDNAMDEFFDNLDDDECMEILNTVENLGLCDTEG